MAVGTVIVVTGTLSLTGSLSSSCAGGGLSVVAAAVAADDNFAAFSLARTLAASASRSVAASLAAIDAMVRGDCCGAADAGRGRRDEPFVLMADEVLEDFLGEDSAGVGLCKETSSGAGIGFSKLLDE